MSKTESETLYSDIIALPHHEPTTRRRMPCENRAASFAPFAALTGHDAKIQEAGRLTQPKRELDDYEKQVLNEQLRLALELENSGSEVTVVYFRPDERKAGGSYAEHTGTLRRIDEDNRTLVFDDKAAIPLENLIGIHWEFYTRRYLGDTLSVLEESLSQNRKQWIL